MIEQMGLTGAKAFHILGVRKGKKSDQELRADIDNTIDQKICEVTSIAQPWAEAREEAKTSTK